MKKERLKGWVKVVLTIIAIISFCFMGGECDDLGMFIASHIIASATFMLATSILYKYER